MISCLRRKVATPTTINPLTSSMAVVCAGVTPLVPITNTCSSPHSSYPLSQSSSTTLLHNTPIVMSGFLAGFVEPKGTDRSPNSHTALRNEKDGSKDIGDEEWKKRLSAKQFQILRGKGTDPGHRNEYDQVWKEGVYHCAGCDTPLYTSVMKFDCGCGWPGFWDCLPKAVREEGADGRPKEILCNA
eukprot:GFYU01076345.1.p1 GENE.GFYU01076345.1~~GFYU01076345.1.p1  ORF type:complete len:186 (+),score=17.97 GFYU01076345.1:3-560(+)